MSLPTTTLNSNLTLNGGAMKALTYAIGTDVISSFTNLASLSGLAYASASFVKMTAAGTFTLDTNTYYKSGDAPTFGNVTIGAGAAGVDYTLTFNGETSDLVLTWMEDEGYLNVGNDLLMESNEKLYLRDTALGIYSQADGYLDLFADTAVRIGNSSAGAPTTYTSLTPAGNVVATGAGRFNGGVGVGKDPTTTDIVAGKLDQNAPTRMRIENATNDTAASSGFFVGPAGASFGMSCYPSSNSTTRYRNRAVFTGDSNITGIYYDLPASASFFIELGDKAGSTSLTVYDTDLATVFKVDSNGNVSVFDSGNIVIGTTTGTKIGTGTNQLLGFYNATPVNQPDAVADATDAASVITQLNALLARIRELGLIAT